jgi:hypothetical protein
MEINCWAASKDGKVPLLEKFFGETLKTIAGALKWTGKGLENSGQSIEKYAKTILLLEDSEEPNPEKERRRNAVRKILVRISEENRNWGDLIAVYGANYQDTPVYILDKISVGNAVFLDDELLEVPFTSAFARIYGNTQMFFNTEKCREKMKDVFNTLLQKSNNAYPIFHDREKETIRGFELGFTESAENIEKEFYNAFSVLFLTGNKIAHSGIMEKDNVSRESIVELLVSENFHKLDSSYFVFVFRGSLTGCYTLVIEDKDAEQYPKVRYHISTASSLVPVKDEKIVIDTFKKSGNNKAYLKSNLYAERVEFYFAAPEKLTQIYTDRFIDQLVKNIQEQK